MDNILIRPLTEPDIGILNQISISTFMDTYARYNMEANMQLHLHEHFNRQQLLAELADKTNYFFAVFNNLIPVGYFKLRTSEKPEALNGVKHIELERIYAVKEFQGKGLGYKMIQYCLDFASVEGYEVLWLGVWNQNEKAQQFYKKCGFKIFGEHSFTLGEDVQVDWLMKKALPLR
ncbi:GNAT family N-acetyltransferase [soil metagenome]